MSRVAVRLFYSETVRELTLSLYNRTSPIKHRRFCYTTTMSKAKEFVDAKIKGNKVVMFSKSYCPYCKMAKKALGNHGVKGDFVEIEDRDDTDEIQDYLLSITGGRSVPRVFIGGKCIGGGSETSKMEREGELLPMLKEVGAV
ncbi:glutaredoxin-1-like [Glandiceps talaboti]